MSESPPAARRWFRRRPVKLLTFVVALPVWAVLVWTDPDERKGMKIFAA